MTAVVWESLVLCLVSASIGLALSTVLVPNVAYWPGLGLSAMRFVELAAAF